MAYILKQVNVKATFPGGREVSGWTKSPPNKTDDSFQVFLSEKADGSESVSVIINPRLAESVEFTFQYQASNFGK
ncbi:hypothetical protein [Pantoea phage PA-1]|nr:hypothetical protein ACO03_11420 [Pantoea ananatis]